MAGDELDLSTGEPEAESGSRRRRRSSSSSSSSRKQEPSSESEATGLLDDFFDRLVKNRRAKGDDELAEALEEDGKAMSQGVMQVTSRFTALRMPLIVVLHVMLALLAFGRVGRIVGGRIMYRRRQQQLERMAAAAGMTMDEYEAAGYPDPSTVLAESGGVAAPQ